MQKALTFGAIIAAALGVRMEALNQAGRECRCKPDGAMKSAGCCFDPYVPKRKPKLTPEQKAMKEAERQAMEATKAAEQKLREE